MPYNTSKNATELWAIVDKKTGAVKWTSGGSSTSSKLMVYSTEGAAKRTFNRYWTKQNPETAEIRKIYTAN